MVPLRAGAGSGRVRAGTNLTEANLGGAHWTRDTKWPSGFFDTIKAASRENWDGVFRVRDVYEVPHSPTTG